MTNDHPMHDRFEELQLPSDVKKAFDKLRKEVKEAKKELARTKNFVDGKLSRRALIESLWGGVTHEHVYRNEARNTDIFYATAQLPGSVKQYESVLEMNGYWRLDGGSQEQEYVERVRRSVWDELFWKIFEEAGEPQQQPRRRDWTQSSALAYENIQAMYRETGDERGVR